MKKFISKPYQLKKNKKWIASGDILEVDGDSLVKITEEFQFRNKKFDTEEEAGEYFSNKCRKLDYSEYKNKDN